MTTNSERPPGRWTPRAPGRRGRDYMARRTRIFLAAMIVTVVAFLLLAVAANSYKLFFLVDRTQGSRVLNARIFCNRINKIADELLNDPHLAVPPLPPLNCPRIEARTRASAG